MKHVVLATLVAFGGCSPAYAQTDNCGERSAVVRHLAEKYGETRQSLGIGPNNILVETFANLDSGSWTVTTSDIMGPMCLVLSGEMFSPTTESLPPEGEDM